MRAAASTASDRNRTASFIPEIESLRGIAITLVFMMHGNAWVTFDSNAGEGTLVSPLGAFALAGHTGVSLFFILSGDLLGRPFLVEGADWLNGWSRLAIVPIAFCCLGCAAVTYWAIERPFLRRKARIGVLAR